MGKSAVKGLFYICLIVATFVLAAITVVAAFSGRFRHHAAAGAGCARPAYLQPAGSPLLGAGTQVLGTGSAGSLSLQLELSDVCRPVPFVQEKDDYGQVPKDSYLQHT